MPLIRTYSAHNVLCEGQIFIVHLESARHFTSIITFNIRENSNYDYSHFTHEKNQYLGRYATCAEGHLASILPFPLYSLTFSLRLLLGLP